MKANELRLGNLFIEEHSDKIIEVIGLEKNKIIFSGMFLDKWQAKPIPLTEEWLLKFGFSIHEDGYITCPNGYQWILHLDNEFEFEALNIIVVYVHQLQNLYFALTNKELTIKQI
jgi:hypothetical protein